MNQNFVFVVQINVKSQTQILRNTHINDYNKHLPGLVSKLYKNIKKISRQHSFLPMNEKLSFIQKVFLLLCVWCMK